MDIFPGYGRASNYSYINPCRKLGYENLAGYGKFHDKEAQHHTLYCKMTGERKYLYGKVYKLHAYIFHERLLIPNHITYDASYFT